MAKKKQNKSGARSTSQPSATPAWKRTLAPAAIALMLSAAAAIFFYGDRIFSSSGGNKNASPVTGGNLANAQPGANTADMGVTGEPIKMRVAQAVVVTLDLDFGATMPSIAEAITQIERGYAPDDGLGRTFAILDAYGEPTAEGKLRVSMHVSSEKPGLATLKDKRSGELLWRARIGNPGDAPAGPKNLSIYIDKGAGNRETFVVDGSRRGNSVLDTYIQNSTQKVRDIWPDGADREVTFVYSACGCPVKVMCRRVGDRTVRTTPLPVIFPDDPDAVSTISNLMKW